jgi:hypothetical protein
MQVVEAVELLPQEELEVLAVEETVGKALLLRAPQVGTELQILVVVQVVAFVPHTLLMVAQAAQVL